MLGICKLRVQYTIYPAKDLSGCELSYLHDEVPLSLPVKVLLGELEGVEKRVGGGQTHVLVRLRALHAVYDGSQDIVAEAGDHIRLYVLHTKT